MAGSIVPGLHQAGRVADEDANTTIGIQLSLNLRNRAQLDDLIRRVSTPGSRDYGKYLTASQFASQFGPTAAQVNDAAGFLRANGLQVTAASPGSTLVDARGTVAAVQQALHTQIGRYREVTGHEFFANDSAPTLPSSLAANVVGVLGLDNRYPRHHSAIQPRACCASIPYALAPAQMRTAFQLASTPLTSLTGAGQTLGLLELDDYRTANITGYDTAYSLPAPMLQRQTVDRGPQITDNGEREVELDIEVMHAIAPAATILVFEAPNSTTQMNDAYGCMINPGGNAACPNHGSLIIAPSNSTSWGLCEPQQGQAETNALGALFVQAAAQGQSFFAASGDTGAYDCQNPNGTVDTSGIWVDSPASDPNVTGVGGTRLVLNTDYTFSSETAWPREPQLYYGSGGGTSIYWPRPSWQTGPGVITTANAPRQVPDLSLDADPQTGYSVFTCAPAPDATFQSCPGAKLTALGGTSAGAPAWAAFTAIYNQYASCQGKPNLGFANTTLYPLGANPQTFTPFNDVTVGDNKEGTTLGYSAGPSYDMVTGWGSLRAADFSQDVAGPMVLKTLNPNSGTALGGNTMSMTGCGFVNKPTVTVDGTPLAGNNVQFISDTNLQVTMPPHALATVQVTVTNSGGSPSNSLPYAYVTPEIVAGVGSDNTPYYQQNLSGWTSLTGGLIAAPAVVSVPGTTGAFGSPIYIGLGGNHDLYVRTATQGWRPLNDLPVYCIDNPGATISASTLTVACQGGDHGLYMVQGAVPAQDVPPFFTRSSWQALGGILTAGPALANVPNRGLDIMVVGGSNHVYEYYNGSYHADGFFCSGHTALASNAGQTLTYFACHALDNSLWWAQDDGVTNGGDWFGAASLGGQIIDGPAISQRAQGPTFFVEGVDHALLHRGTSAGYAYDGGYINYGTAAATLF